ncbi:MAG: aminotransferase class V-fold PLP-dependent enzyme [Deltaproteobacteria bacterium]|nr:aminotransferase class V-fold PLP-dependent enzyme [Deltaproteobacteria bacterium]
MQPIYLDNAASTRVSDEVLALMTEVMRTAWGNPSAAHPQGAAARAFLDTARTRMLAALGDRGIGDVVWTSGCSEANALAVLGAARTHEGSIVISTLEHPAITTLADRLEAEGRRVVRVAPGPGGVLDPDELAAASKGAGVVAFLGVQNEIGVVQPVAAIAQAVRAVAPSAHLHLDAAQALGKVVLDVAQLGVDSIAIAGHKLHGPKGAGALWLRNGARIEPLWVGGGQQHGMRGGTQDAPGAAGLGLAAERAATALTTARARWLELAANVTQTLEARGIAFRQLVPDHRRAPHILALGIAGIPAGALRNVLASRGVYISTGSACSADGVKASPTLAAIGLPEDHGMVRLSFALDTTTDDVARAATILADVASELGKRPS